MSELIDSFDRLKAEELHKTQAAQKEIVRLLQTLARKLEHMENPSRLNADRLAEMKSDLDFKQMQMGNSASTSERLGQELERRKSALRGAQAVGAGDDSAEPMDDVQYAVTGPSAVAREASMFALQVWAMVEAQVERFEKAFKRQLLQGDKQWSVELDDLDEGVATLIVRVAVTGCTVHPSSATLDWNRKIKSSRTPPGSGPLTSHPRSSSNVLS